MLQPKLIVSIILISLCPPVFSLSVRNASCEVTFILRAVMVAIDTEAFFLTIYEFTIVHITIFIYVPSPTPSTPLLPPTFIDLSIRPYHLAFALDELLVSMFKPLTFVDAAITDRHSWLLNDTLIPGDLIIELLPSSLALIVVIFVQVLQPLNNAPVLWLFVFDKGPIQILKLILLLFIPILPYQIVLIVGFHG